MDDTTDPTKQTDSSNPTFEERVIEIIKNWFIGSGFKARKLTDTPTDALQVVNKAYVDANPPLPGGSDKNVQYDNNGAFGGISNNATSTNMYLNQVSSGTPVFQQVSDSHLLMHDTTVNDVGTSNHGFAPKSPNDATKFLDGTGVYSVPIAFKASLATYDLSTASGTQTIAHGLGRVPKFVQLHITTAGPGSAECVSIGNYDGTTNSSAYFWGSEGASAVDAGGYTTNAAHVIGHNTSTGNFQTGVITVDATNITITWTKTNAPTGTANILWSVMG